MRRQILNEKREKHISGCCPGHDDFPNSVYRSNRSKRARARSIKLEHRYARRVAKQRKGE
jgi:hypothetical protein